METLLIYYAIALIVLFIVTLVILVDTNRKYNYIKDILDREFGIEDEHKKTMMDILRGIFCVDYDFDEEDYDPEYDHDSDKIVHISEAGKAKRKKNHEAPLSEGEAFASPQELIDSLTPTNLVVYDRRLGTVRTILNIDKCEGEDNIFIYFTDLSVSKFTPGRFAKIVVREAK